MCMALSFQVRHTDARYSTEAFRKPWALRAFLSSSCATSLLSTLLKTPSRSFTQELQPSSSASMQNHSSNCYRLFHFLFEPFFCQLGTSFRSNRCLDFFSSLDLASVPKSFSFSNWSFWFFIPTLHHWIRFHSYVSACLPRNVHVLGPNGKKTLLKLWQLLFAQLNNNHHQEPPHGH